MKNGEYKESLFNLIERAIVEGKGDLSDKTIYFFNQSECKKKARCKVSVSHELCSDHKEADTELVPLVQAAHITPGEAVMVPSPSGDTILALFVTHDFNGVQVLVDNGAGKSRKVIDITYSTLPDDKRKALLGLNAYSSNDYVSSFFRKWKTAFWKDMLQTSEFDEMFAALGSMAHASDELTQDLEKFVCFLYGDQRIRSVDKLRYKMFMQKFEKEGKVLDLSLLPPSALVRLICSST